MKKYLFFIAAGLLALYSCTALEPENIDSQMDAPATISIPMTSEDVSIDPSTKAYLNATSSTDWSFVWEDGDQLSFYQYRLGMLRNHGFAEVDKRPSSSSVIYNAADFKAGDVIYSYLYQPEAEAELGEYGLSNSDPSNLYFQIPTFQITSSDPESYDYTEDLSFQISNVKLPDSPSYTISGSSNAQGVVPRSITIKFKIIGYNRDLVYMTGPNTSSLRIDVYGNASVKVNFDPITNYSNKKGSTKTNVKVFVKGYEDYYANIPVTVNAAGKDAIPIIGSLIGQPAKVTYSYSTTAPTGAVINLDIHEDGLVKPYPVRNCMPCVSKKTTITANHIQHPEDIQSAMTMYMLGSVVEFRLYSLDDAIGVGETLSAVSFSSQDGECAGMCTYDLLGQGLNLTNMTDSDIISYDADGKVIKNGKENYVSLYMVLAPGTYTATATFITDQNVYILDLGTKEYKRATRKAVTCNIAGSSFTRIPLSEYYSYEPESSSSEDEEY